MISQMLIDLIFTEGCTLVLGMTGLAALFVFLTLLGFLGWFGDVRGWWLTGIG